MDFFVILWVEMHELVDLYRGGRKVEDLLGRDWRVMVLRWVPARGQWGFYLHWSALIPYRGCRCLCFAEVCHGCFGHLGQLVPVHISGSFGFDFLIVAKGKPKKWSAEGYCCHLRWICGTNVCVFWPMILLGRRRRDCYIRVFFYF